MHGRMYPHAVEVFTVTSLLAHGPLALMITGLLYDYQHRSGSWQFSSWFSAIGNGLAQQLSQKKVSEYCQGWQEEYIHLKLR